MHVGLVPWLGDWRDE